MSPNQKIAESLELLFARQELVELRTNEGRLELELGVTQHQLAKANESLNEKTNRIHQLERELLKFVEEFLGEKHKRQQSTTEPIKPHTAKKNSNKTNRKTNSDNFEEYPLVLYFIYCEPAQAVKIGYTFNIRARLSNIQVGNPYKLSLVTCFPIPDNSWEGWLHKMFNDFWIKGEWFTVTKNMLREISCIPKFKTYNAETWKELSEHLFFFGDILKDAYQYDNNFVKTNRANTQTVKTIDSVDSYLLSLPESISLPQKSLMSGSGALTIK